MKNKFLFPFSVFSIIIINSFSQSVRVTHLANEGVLIESGNSKLIIDGLFTQEFDYLDVLDEKTQQRLVAADEPFDDVDFILATHFHGDHFSQGLVLEYLENHPRSIFISTNETVSKLDSELKNAFKNQLIAQTPDLHQSNKLGFSKNLKIEILRTRHLGVSPWNKAENVAFLITVDNKKILHWGDGEITEENLSAFQLQEENIDLAVLPVWALSSPDQKNLIDEYISPKQVVISHIPLGIAEDQLFSIKSIFPKVVLWNKQLEELNL